MTTRIYPDAPTSNIFSVLHEGGHGLYNKNLPQNQYGSPLGQQVSLGIDESQSRWWETLIGRSLPFWEHFFPLLQDFFPAQFQSVKLETFYSAINAVNPSFIRVEADEVTYGLHVIIRYEIEKQLIEGTLTVKQIPEAWNQKMHAYLGITPKNYGEGCLQDIHWSMGSFGYFPTYILGNLYAAQCFTKFATEHPQWQESVRQGQLGFIQEWLKEHIHRFGSQFTPGELITRISGKPLTEQPYVSYLNQKYQKLYSF
jgi:carboxypeptidase Taq